MRCYASAETDEDLIASRHFVLQPPFNRWLIFCRPIDHGVAIQGVPYGNINWRQEPELFLGIPGNTLVPKLSTLELPFFVSWMFLALQWASV
jgi:hypothetical protein